MMIERMINKILIVDDTEIIRDLLSEVLENDGYHADIAADGIQAVEMCQEKQYDLVFCDVHMPRQNGLTTIRKILDISPSTKIIMSDSYPDKLAKTAIKEGAIGCICKPFDLGELRTLLQQLDREIREEKGIQQEELENRTS